MTCNIWQLIFVALVFMVQISFAGVAFNTSTLSTPRVGFSAIEADSKVYFIGGFEHGDLTATRTIEVYDLISQNASSIQLSSPRAFATPVVIDPNIYIVGGVYYTNPTYIYDPIQHEYINYGTGPTVVNTQRITLYNTFLAVIGSNGVDILDVQSGNWTDPVPLRKLLSGMASCAIFSEEGVVVVLGGVDVATNVYSSSVWVYDMTSGDLQEYPDMVTAPFMTQNVTASIAANGVVALRIGRANAGDTVLLYHVARRSWKTIVSLEKLRNVLSMPGVTFLFNDTQLVTLYWNSTDNQPIYQTIAFKHAFMLNNSVIYMTKYSDGAAMQFNIYNAERDIWIATAPKPTIEVTFSVSLAHYQVFATTNKNIYGYDLALDMLYGVTDSEILAFSTIVSMIPAEDLDAVYIFELDQKVTKTTFFSGGAANTIKQQPVAIIPQVRIGSDFINADGLVMNSNNWLQVTNHNLTLSGGKLYDSDNERFVIASLLDPNADKVNYNRVDIYNYVTNEWNSTDMPAELINNGFVVRWFYSAAALDNKLVVWMDTVMAVYDPVTGNWTTYTNYTQPIVNNESSSFLHLPVPRSQGLAFMRTNNNTLDVFSADSLPAWNSTVPAPAVEDIFKYVFQQMLVHNDSRLYVTSRALGTTGNPDRFNSLYIYDVRSGTWKYEQLPNALSSVPTIALAGNFLLSMNEGILSYRDLVNGGLDEQQLDFTFSPAVVLETSANVTIIAGGISAFNAYVDRIMIIPHNAITISPPVSNNDTYPETPSTSPSGLTQAEFIVAIVVPIGAALIATALLVFFLVRRNKRRRRQGGSDKMIGLAGKYGQWFIPFESIKFGDQLGQGASGQVFKGTWNSTTVALKVSMTQANSTVIGELELMMQLRPHPNVIQLFGFSVHPETDSIILVIEYCNGGSLDDALFEAKQPLSVQQKLTWLVGMAKGLEHLHANNIVHRDIAARNVLLHQNEPKITDFGMSRLIDSDKQRGTTKSELGPIRWMSPESLRNKEYSNKSGTCCK